ncbi:hypothetical protein KAR02_08960 [Candidatus Bipolaricaulota bacterium]|nr:hypothetical protein [Candidatus Bipolaricaulota bacterium]
MLGEAGMYFVAVKDDAVSPTVVEGSVWLSDREDEAAVYRFDPLTGTFT